MRSCDEVSVWDAVAVDTAPSALSPPLWPLTKKRRSFEFLSLVFQVVWFVSALI